MILKLTECPNCKIEIKPSYSYCPDCGFYWGNCGKNGLEKKLKLWQRIRVTITDPTE